MLKQRPLHTELTVVVVSDSVFQNDTEAKRIINLIPRDLLPKVEACLCFSKPVAGQGNLCH